jgi:hypothetical protein
VATYKIEDAGVGFLKRKNEFLRNATLFVQTAARTFQEQVVEDTPVDTGRARSNWVASEGSPFDGVIEPYAPGSGLGRGEGANKEAAIAQAEGIIQGFVAREGGVLYIANNVPYIGYLNDPSTTNKPSHQSYENFIQLALQKAADAVGGKLVFVGG